MNADTYRVVAYCEPTDEHETNATAWDLGSEQTVMFARGLVSKFLEEGDKVGADKPSGVALLRNVSNFDTYAVRFSPRGTGLAVYLGPTAHLDMNVHADPFWP